MQSVMILSEQGYQKQGLRMAENHMVMYANLSQQVRLTDTGDF